MIKKILKNIREKALFFLNITQFTGAFNDNFFLGIMTYFLIGIKGSQHASAITAISFGIMFLPPIIFLSYAGFLADKFRKTNIIFMCKIAELFVMLLGVFAIYLQSEIFCYFLLFLMGSQTAFFNPSKYGIISEIVEKNSLTSANVKVTIYTSVAILFGELFASFFTHILNKNFYLIALLPVFVSAVGIFSSKKIDKTISHGTKSNASPIFFVDIYKNLKLASKTPFLLYAIFSGSAFWFIGAYIKMNLIPLLSEGNFVLFNTLLDDASKGYIYFFMIVGGVFGANIVSRYNIRGLGLPIFLGFLFPLLLFSIPFMSAEFLILDIFLLGIVLTAYYIPIDVFVQENVSEHEKGRVISFHQLSSFVFMFVSSLFLYFFNSFLGLSAANSFIAISCVVLLFNIYLCFCLSPFVFPSFSKHVLKKIYDVILSTKLPEARSYVMMANRSFLDFFLFFSFFSRGKAIVLLSSKKWGWMAKRFFKGDSSITFLKKEGSDLDIATKILSVASSIRTSEDPVLISVPEALRSDILRLCSDINSRLYLMRSKKNCWFKVHYHFDHLLDYKY